MPRHQIKQHPKSHRSVAQAIANVRLIDESIAFPAAAYDRTPHEPFGPWIGEKYPNMVHLEYIRGDDPWDFYLGHVNEPLLQHIWSMIRYQLAKGEIKKCLPKVGKLVVCRSLRRDEPDYFRGLILKFNPKAMESVRSVLVFKVDYGTMITVFPDDVYCFPSGRLGDINFQVVRCSLLESDPHLKDKFCEELRSSFKNVLKTSILTLNFFKHDKSYPPRYSVDLWAFDANRCIADENLNRWITDRVIPRLRNIPCEATNLSLYLDQVVLDPYFGQLEEYIDACGAGGNVPLTADLNTTKDDRVPATSDCTAPGLPHTPHGTGGNSEESIVANFFNKSRICQFYLNYGFCGRKLCSKEHIEKSLLWTIDVIPSYDAVFNDLRLPEDGTEVLVTIQTLMTPVAFYINLPDEFSCTGEPGVLETAASLHADLNSLESNNSHPLLSGSPRSAQLVIALGRQEALGPRKKWLRARVIQMLDETHAEVFYIDYGNNDIVKTKDLRAMRPRFLHLPAQAVLARLHHLAEIPEKREDAMTFLAAHILGKKLKATVVSQLNGELAVRLFTTDGACVNERLVDEHLVKKL